jgi:hypothetical protein
MTCPEELYRLWRVVVCDHETSWYEEAIACAGLQSQRKTINRYLWGQPRGRELDVTLSVLETRFVGRRKHSDITLLTELL